MRYNTQERMRWGVVKAMLDDFPQLRDRTKRYLLGKEDSAEKNQIAYKDPNVSRLLKKALNEYRLERSQK